ncbi:MAG TPA: ABC transporter permease [Candidatus Limnocylindria bacterium]|nr:ABC transporter permease [Candidatus Limnocylindria bacterium]
MRQLLALIRLDLKLFRSDRRALIMLFVVPIGLASFMGSVFNSSGGKSSPGGGLAILLVDQDDSAVSRGVVDAFATDETFRVTVTNEAAARDLVLNGKRPLALVLPAGFGADALPSLFDTNRKPVIRLLHDPSRSTEKSMVEGMLVPKVVQAVARNGLSLDLGRDYIRRGLTNLDRATNLSGHDQRLYRSLMERADEFLATRTNRSLFGSAGGATNGGGAKEFTFPLPFVTKAEALTKNAKVQYNGYSHSFGGMSLQFVLMSLLEMSVTLLRERESGMFRRLRAAPLGRGTLLLGKGLSYALIGLLSLAGCFAFSMVVFGVRVEGSWLGFIVCLVLTSLMASSLGLALAALGRTPAGTRGIGIAVVLLLLMVGGAWVPSFIFPRWIQQAALITPTRWALDGFDAMTWRGLGLDAALAPAGMLLGFIVLFSTITWLRFKWTPE